MPELERPAKPWPFLNGEYDTKTTGDITKKLMAAQQTIQVLKNGNDLNKNDAKSIERAIVKLETDKDCKSLLKNHLTSKAVFDEIAVSKKQKELLFDCVKLGLVDHQDDVGLIAADGDCYSHFATLFEPIIEQVHGELPDGPLNLSWDYDVIQLVDPDPENEFIQRAVINCRRSFTKIPFQVKIKNEKKFSSVLQAVISHLWSKFNDNDLRNQVYKFEDLDAVKKAELLEKNLIFDESEFDETLEFVGAKRAWPIGRAAYVADDHSYVIWVNRIDHLEFKSFDKNVVKAIKQITAVGKIIDGNMKLFQSSDKYGWLNCSPKYIGNAMRVSVFMKLTKFSGKARDEILEKYKLIINSSEVDDKGSTIYEIQNKSCLCTQFETMKNVLAAITDIIKNEKGIEFFLNL